MSTSSKLHKPGVVFFLFNTEKNQFFKLRYLVLILRLICGIPWTERSNVKWKLLVRITADKTAFVLRICLISWYPWLRRPGKPTGTWWLQWNRNRQRKPWRMSRRPHITWVILVTLLQQVLSRSVVLFLNPSLRSMRKNMVSRLKLTFVNRSCGFPNAVCCEM